MVEKELQRKAILDGADVFAKIKVFGFRRIGAISWTFYYNKKNGLFLGHTNTHEALNPYPIIVLAGNKNETARGEPLPEGIGAVGAGLFDMSGREGVTVPDGERIFDLYFKVWGEPLGLHWETDQCEVAGIEAGAPILEVMYG